MSYTQPCLKGLQIFVLIFGKAWTNRGALENWKKQVIIALFQWEWDIT